jgi:mRNA interferase HicA
MVSETFRKWLAERGCRFDLHEHEERGEGQVVVTVHREGRIAKIPLGGSRQTLDPRTVRAACEELGLDWTELPGPAGRV